MSSTRDKNSNTSRPWSHILFHPFAPQTATSLPETVTTNDGMSESALTGTDEPISLVESAVDEVGPRRLSSPAVLEDSFVDSLDGSYQYSHATSSSSHEYLFEPPSSPRPQTASLPDLASTIPRSATPPPLSPLRPHLTLTTSVGSQSRTRRRSSSSSSTSSSSTASASSSSAQYSSGLFGQLRKQKEEQHLLSLTHAKLSSAFGLGGNVSASGSNGASVPSSGGSGSALRSLREVVLLSNAWGLVAGHTGMVDDSRNGGHAEGSPRDGGASEAEVMQIENVDKDERLSSGDYVDEGGEEDEDSPFYRCPDTPPSTPAYVEAARPSSSIHSMSSFGYMAEAEAEDDEDVELKKAQEAAWLDEVLEEMIMDEEGETEEDSYVNINFRKSSDGDGGEECQPDSGFLEKANVALEGLAKRGLEVVDEEEEEEDDLGEDAQMEDTTQADEDEEDEELDAPPARMQWSFPDPSLASSSPPSKPITEEDLRQPVLRSYPRTSDRSLFELTTQEEDHWRYTPHNLPPLPPSPEVGPIPIGPKSPLPPSPWSTTMDVISGPRMWSRYDRDICRIADSEAVDDEPPELVLDSDPESRSPTVPLPVTPESSPSPTTGFILRDFQCRRSSSVPRPLSSPAPALERKAKSSSGSRSGKIEHFGGSPGADTPTPAPPSPALSTSMELVKWQRPPGPQRTTSADSLTSSSAMEGSVVDTRIEVIVPIPKEDCYSPPAPEELGMTSPIVIQFPKVVREEDEGLKRAEADLAERKRRDSLALVRHHPILPLPPSPPWQANFEEMTASTFTSTPPRELPSVQSSIPGPPKVPTTPFVWPSPSTSRHRKSPTPLSAALPYEMVRFYDVLDFGGSPLRESKHPEPPKDTPFSFPHVDFEFKGFGTVAGPESTQSPPEQTSSGRSGRGRRSRSRGRATSEERPETLVGSCFAWEKENLFSPEAWQSAKSGNSRSRSVSRLVDLVDSRENDEED